MPKTTFKPNREVAPVQLANALTAFMQRYLPLEFEHTHISPDEGLLWALHPITTWQPTCQFHWTGWQPLFVKPRSCYFARNPRFSADSSPSFRELLIVWSSA